MPYDEFLLRQLAVDKLHPSKVAEHVALGFIGLGPKYYRRNSPEVMADEWEDRVDTVTRGLLGLTVACARCHDHKYDPIPTSDYYSLAGVFASTEMFNRALPGKKAGKNGQAKNPSDSIHVVRDAKPRDLHVMIRGDVSKKGALARRKFLSVLGGKSDYFSEGSGRLELAQAIASDTNPLTARVIVNRIWAQYFGRGLVGTPSNFGKLGQRPSHPQLLDDLTRRFMQNGWSIKWLHRQILLSATYRQSSDLSAAKLKVDAANQWLARMPRRRLSVEAWRDAILVVAGRLDRRVGGPSIDPVRPEETRRTVYAGVSRLELNPILALFDFPDPNAHSAARSETTTPLQKLFMLNNPFMVKAAESLAARVRQHASVETEQIDYAYRLLYGRRPTVEEAKVGAEYLATHSDKLEEGWALYAHILMVANEMLIID